MRDMWPEPVPLRVKLYGNLEEFREDDRHLRPVYEEEGRRRKDSDTTGPGADPNTGGERLTTRPKASLA